MAETSHARSRRASLAGLVLQIIAALAAFALSRTLDSSAMTMLALYVAGGIPIWFIALLVFRQHELAALEAMDLEELRREKQAGGVSEAIFGEGGGALGFAVAQARLEWMRRWLVPLFGLLTAVYLIAVGIVMWIHYIGIDVKDWPALDKVQIGLVVTALPVLFLFFFSRYASGMARVGEWQLLRGGGSYMLGNALAGMAIIIALGANLYQGTTSWERVIAFAIPVLMAALGAEMLVNFLLDLYRPRSPGVDPRACFDSRLLGLVSEPGGIAHSLAEAINYQFGFQVSQTWFYQLLQRAFIPLTCAGVLAVWLLSCFVVVQPYERVIIEFFGRQVNAETPLEPGLHFKWPWPIEVASQYNTDQLHEFYVGYRDFDQPKWDREKPEGMADIELWTDRQHGGRDHFDFVISPTPPEEDSETKGAAEQADKDQRAAQHLARMVVVVQYTIDPNGLADFTQHAEDPHALLRKLAWNEVVQFGAANQIDALLGEARFDGGEVLRKRIVERARDRKLGVDIKYVGILQVHPTKDVSESFRAVVQAQQERIAKIREARVTENKTLSKVAGDKRKALAISHAIDEVQVNELRRSELDRALRGMDRESNPLREPGALDTVRPLIDARLRAKWTLDLEQQILARIRKDFELGLGGSMEDQARAATAVELETRALREAETRLAAEVKPLRDRLLKYNDAAVVDAWIEQAETLVALDFWNRRLEEDLTGLKGAAAVTLSEAQARRWQLEMRAAGELALLQNERYVFAAAPEIYKARSYLQVLVNGIKDARKYFMAFEPGERKVHVRLEAQEQARPDIVDIPTDMAE